jgi:hypothetical protein
MGCKTLVAAAILLNAAFAAAVWWSPAGVPLDGWRPNGRRTHIISHG